MNIYFYCFPERPEDSTYQHSLVALAEGLQALGIETFANANYWRTGFGDEFLLRHDRRVGPADCSAVVLEHIWFLHGNTFPDELFREGRPYITAFVDRSDGSGKGKYSYTWDEEFRRFDHIFKTHYNDGCHHPSNVHPWAFGLTNRIVTAAENVADSQPRDRRLLVNFRVNHRLRNQIRRQFLPLIAPFLSIDDSIDGELENSMDEYDRLHWMQTGMRHDPRYYRRLTKSVACAAFGGSFIPNFPRDQFAPETSLHRLANRFSRSPRRLLQWDSWRFWESLICGCATLHVNLPRYGALLPEMPENWRHYIGVDLDDLSDAVNRIMADPEILTRVGSEGRAWALEFYSPIPTARRFLRTLGLPTPTSSQASRRQQIPPVSYG